MTTIVTRVGKGAPLSITEVDDNFSNLNSYKVEQTSATGAAMLPVGDTASRPGTPTSGLVRYNSETGQYEGYVSTDWLPLGGAVLTDDTATNSSFYLTLTNATTGVASALKVSSTKLSFNPSTGVLNAAALDTPSASIGTLTATNPINGSITGNANTATNVAASGITGTTLASNVVSSSLTSVGTLVNLSVTNPINGSVTGSAGSVSAGNVVGQVAIAAGGTGASSATAALTNLLPGGASSGYVLTTGGTGSYYWAAASGGGSGNQGTLIQTNRFSYSATASQTYFNGLAPFTSGAGQVRVYIQGVRQFPSEYSEQIKSSDISNVARTGTLVTITTSTDHGLVSGDKVYVAAVTNTDVNVSGVTCTVTAANAFTYNTVTSGTITSQADTGTVKAYSITLTAGAALNDAVFVEIDGYNTYTQLASATSYSPTGTISATNVQNALNELDSEKVARAGDTLTGNLTLATGTTSVAPLTFAAGTNLTSPIAGSMEYDGSALYLTITGNTRKTLAYNDLFSTSGTTPGLVPGSNGDSTKFLKGDGTWAVAVDLAGDNVWTGQQQYKETKDTVYTISGTTPVLDPANGGIQLWTLTGASTPTEAFESGQSVMFMINDGTAYTITWPSINWVGGVAPSLHPTQWTLITLWKVNTTLYGSANGTVS